MRTLHAVCGNKWRHCERRGLISYVQVRMRFVVRIRMRQTEAVHVSAHDMDKKFHSDAITDVFSQLSEMAETY